MTANQRTMLESWKRDLAAERQLQPTAGSAQRVNFSLSLRRLTTARRQLRKVVTHA
jgi:hypothetical protein